MTNLTFDEALRIVANHNGETIENARSRNPAMASEHILADKETVYLLPQDESGEVVVHPIPMSRMLEDNNYRGTNRFKIAKLKHELDSFQWFASIENEFMRLMRRCLKGEKLYLPPEMQDCPHFNIAEILKDCDLKKTVLYSPIVGKVRNIYLDGTDEMMFICGDCNLNRWFSTQPDEMRSKRCYFTQYGVPLIDDWFDNHAGECMLFPSETFRDWSKVTVENGIMKVCGCETNAAIALKRVKKIEDSVKRTCYLLGEYPIMGMSADDRVRSLMKDVSELIEGWEQRITSISPDKRGRELNFQTNFAKIYFGRIQYFHKELSKVLENIDSCAEMLKNHSREVESIIFEEEVEEKGGSR